MTDQGYWRQVIATDGDFTTSSKAFVGIPGLTLSFEVEQPEVVYFNVQATISSDPCEIALYLDGLPIATIGFHSEPRIQSLIPITIPLLDSVGPGAHLLELYIRPVGEFPPEGPREWSPRKPQYPTVTVMKSIEMPAILRVNKLR